MVTISAPDFVRLDKSKVQLKEKENAKVLCQQCQDLFESQKYILFDVLLNESSIFL